LKTFLPTAVNGSETKGKTNLGLKRSQNMITYPISSSSPFHLSRLFRPEAVPLPYLGIPQVKEDI